MLEDSSGGLRVTLFILIMLSPMGLAPAGARILEHNPRLRDMIKGKTAKLSALKSKSAAAAAPLPAELQADSPASPSATQATPEKVVSTHIQNQSEPVVVAKTMRPPRPLRHPHGTARVFAPPPETPAAEDLLARRDGYKLWCRQAGIAADFPRRFVPARHIAAADDAAGLVASARLFAGRFAACQKNQSLFEALTPDDRKWCTAIATTRPMRSVPSIDDEPGESIEVGGLLELARRLELQFPGLWPRLCLLLAPEIAARVSAPLTSASLAPDTIETSETRAQRCWTVCRQRAAAPSATHRRADATEEEPAAAVA